MPRKYDYETIVGLLRREHPGLYEYKHVSADSRTNKFGVLAKCPQHGWFIPNTRVRNKPLLCAKCSHEEGNRKKLAMDFPTFVKKARNVRGDALKGIVKPEKLLQCGKISVECTKHGWVTTSPRSVLDKTRSFCGHCWKESSGADLLMTTEEFRESLVKRWGPEKISLVGATKYLGMNKEIPVICPHHGRQLSTPARLLPKKWKVQQGNWCIRCTWDAANDKKRKHTESTFLLWLQNKYGDTVSDYSRVKYNGVMAPVHLKCPTHGWQSPLLQTLELGKGSGGVWCTECVFAGYRLINSNEDAVRVIEDKLGHLPVGQRITLSKNNKTTLSSVLGYNSELKITLNCETHGDFQKTVKSLVNNRGYTPCRRCGYTVTKPHLRLLSLFDELGTATEQNYRGGNLRYPGSQMPFELDIFVPGRNLAVEINGVYWHSDARPESRHGNKHLHKAVVCRRAGIRLLQFWDTQIMADRQWPIVRSMIKHALGLSKTIYARDTALEEISNKEARQFYSEHHLQGPAPATKESVSLGLYFTDRAGSKRLVAAATFDSPRFARSYDWEILRMAFHRGCSVVGGASRLHTAFVRQCSPASIITYADAFHSLGGVYLALGYKLVRRTSPSYRWVNLNSGLIKSRYQTQKGKLEDLLGSLDMEFYEEASEEENMRANNFYKIFDAGNHVLEWVPA